MNQIQIRKPGRDNPTNEPPKPFTFDRVYAPGSAQKLVYDQTARPIVEDVLGGYNGTIFAYGQTGTGKTFTMEGVPEDDNLRGIMPNSFFHVFEAVNLAPKNMEFLVRVSFLEIYMEDVYDLLNKGSRTKMEVKEHKEKGVYVKDLTTYVVKSVPDMLKVLKVGQKARKVGATKMNEGSSRSHSIFTVTIETSVLDGDGNQHYKSGKLNMVDLAGSERQKRTEAQGERLDEAKAINLSLSALGNVIKALVSDKAKYVPFRDSKLTRLLQDSLGGNTKTVMCANLGPSEYSFDETMGTLRYANRAKNIKNKPRINEDPKDAMLRQMQEEISALKAQLEARKQGLGMRSLPPGMAMHPGDEGPQAPLSPMKVVEEQVVEKVVVDDTGVNEDDLKRMEEQAKAEAERLMMMTEAERSKILKEKQRAEQAASLYEEELRRKQELLEKEKNDLEEMQRRIAEREKQLLVGGQDLDKAAKQKVELSKTEEELRKQENERKKMEQELVEVEDRELFLNEQYSNAQEEIKKKTVKLKKLWQKLSEKKDELEDLQDEFEGEREELIDTIRALDRQNKLRDLLLNWFIPPQYIEAIESRAQKDPYSDEWTILGAEYAAANIQEEEDAKEQHRRAGPPISSFISKGPSLGKGFDREPVQEVDIQAAMEADRGPQMPRGDVYFQYQPEAEAMDPNDPTWRRRR